MQQTPPAAGFERQPRERGFSCVGTTFDIYGHLMPGGEDEAAALADAYLERANTRARLASLDG
jgi:hypothetical protein